MLLPRQFSRRHMLAVLFQGCASLAMYPSLIAESASFGSDVRGQPVQSLAPPLTRYIVLVFVATDCPISNRYLPEIARLSEEFSARDVRFWLVYPNPADDLAAVRAHQVAYPIVTGLAQLIAPDRQLCRGAHTHVTPEAAIFSGHAPRSAPAVWHGRIDNRYLSFGRQRPSATRHDLADAIQVLLAGRPPSQPPAPPVGCAIIPRT